MSATKIALSVVAQNTAEARRIMEANAGQIDVAELRLDLMASFDLVELLDDPPCEVIVTYRAEREGGRYSGSEKARLRVLAKAADLGAEHIDCEWDAVRKLGVENLGSARLIASRHFFTEMPEDFPAVYQAVSELRPHVVKVVGMAQSLLDAAVPLDALRTAVLPSICLAMGVPGAVSRVLAPKYGAYLTFAAQGTGEQEAAPGQMTLDVMRRVYHAHEIDAFTEVYGWLTPCNPPQDRVAEVNEALRGAGLNAVVVPLSTDVDDPIAVLRAYGRLGFADFAVHPACGEVPGAEEIENLPADFFVRRHKKPS